MSDFDFDLSMSLKVKSDGAVGNPIMIPILSNSMAQSAVLRSISLQNLSDLEIDISRLR